MRSITSGCCFIQKCAMGSITSGCCFIQRSHRAIFPVFKWASLNSQVCFIVWRECKTVPNQWARATWATRGIHNWGCSRGPIEWLHYYFVHDYLSTSIISCWTSYCFSANLWIYECNVIDGHDSRPVTALCLTVYCTCFCVNKPLTRVCTSFILSIK